MKKKRSERSRANVPLGHRERQIVDAVVRLKEATVGDVLANIPEPPTYSTVRKMLSVLEEKGLLKHRVERTKYIYSTVESSDSYRRSAMQSLLGTFFGGSATEAVNTILDLSGEELTPEDFSRLRAMIKKAQAEGK